jgi:hypothetical protein
MFRGVSFAAGCTALTSTVAESGRGATTSRAPVTGPDAGPGEDAGDEWLPVDVDFVTGDGEPAVLPDAGAEAADRRRPNRA